MCLGLFQPFIQPWKPPLNLCPFLNQPPLPSHHCAQAMHLAQLRLRQGPAAAQAAPQRSLAARGRAARRPTGRYPISAAVSVEASPAAPATKTVDLPPLAADFVPPSAGLPPAAFGAPRKADALVLEPRGVAPGTEVPAVVFCHGFSQPPTNYLSLLRKFSEQGWLVVAPNTGLLDTAFAAVETVGWRGKPPAKLQVRRRLARVQASVATSPPPRAALVRLQPSPQRWWLSVPTSVGRLASPTLSQPVASPASSPIPICHADRPHPRRAALRSVCAPGAAAVARGRRAAVRAQHGRRRRRGGRIQAQGESGRALAKITPLRPASSCV